jgi:S1-C subfamily serine protease
MRMFDRRIVLNLFWMAMSLGLAAVLMLAGTSLARGESPSTSRDSSPVLLAFRADWCNACRQMEPMVDALASDGYSVRQVDVDRDRELAARFGVDAIPCFIVVQNGNVVDRIVGQASIERLKLKLPRLASPQREARDTERRPHPAWRYEIPVGHRAAVVRIYCQDDLRTRSIGSGTLVRWGAKKIVVLTARHVIQDAKKITVELFNKKAYKARVMKADAVWDCAVLELIGKPVGVEPAELELGDAAMQQEGNRLESCGYGPDGRLACNTGLFLGYKRSTQTPNGPDDWFEISGHARQGDSGGGVFNQRGRLVGVLWGTNGEVVVGVQAGRLHVLLDQATGNGGHVEQRRLIVSADSESNAIDPENFRLLQYQSRPTPPKQPVADLADLPQCDPRSGCCPMPGPVFAEPAGDCPNLPSPNLGEGQGVRACENGTVPFDARGNNRIDPVLPWREGAQRRDEELNARTNALLNAIRAERQARLARESVPPVAVEQPKAETEKDTPSPLLAGLCVLGAVAAGFVIYFATAKNQ